jgi:hypothetical protein
MMACGRPDRACSHLWRLKRPGNSISIGITGDTFGIVARFMPETWFAGRTKDRLRMDNEFVNAPLASSGLRCRCPAPPPDMLACK